MMSSSVPGSALNWRTASRRLPLPRPPSAKVVGVMVAGTQRDSKGSTRNHLRWRGARRRRGHETAAARTAFTHRESCHFIKGSSSTDGKVADFVQGVVHKFILGYLLTARTILPVRLRNVSSVRPSAGKSA